MYSRPSPLPPRDMLQSTVAALRGAVAGSLQLAAVVDSVLGGGAGAQGGEGLPEELLAKVSALIDQY